RGILEEDFVDLSQATTRNLEMVAVTPSSALGSTRDKPDQDYCARMVEVFRKHNVRYFFYIGGNDSAETCHIMNAYAQSVGYELRVIHVPKTIDNDLMGTDHCPGYGSAARFVTSAFACLDLDNFAIPGVFLGVVMGRHAGWLTASSVFARRFKDDGPHLIYVPERVFDIDHFLADVDRVYSKLGRCVVALSEGVVAEDGQPVLLKLQKDAVERDAFGNVQLSGRGTLGDALSDMIRDNLKIRRIRCDTFGYLQRSFLGVVSELDASEAREVGEMAVHFATYRETCGSVSIQRTGDYAVDYTLTPLEQVAGHTRLLPEEFLEGHADITESFRDYARPLMGAIPRFDRLIAPVVGKS
ncbi:MAG: diphosphate--fructose-6-phosphate 1-phosphotransferase, partial [Firmicutes bacterium]|nr:diphosphate--fructose-6-phosphate 1-phosphotransferase [Bacillota bacterium]